MASLHTTQQRIHLHGRDLHFVAYEEQPANLRRGIERVPAMWFLMAGASRCPVMEFDPNQPGVDLIRALTQWAECNAFAAPTRHAAPPSVARDNRRRWEE